MLLPRGEGESAVALNHRGDAPGRERLLGLLGEKGEDSLFQEVVVYHLDNL